MILNPKILSSKLILQKHSGKPVPMPEVKTGQLLRAQVVALLPQGKVKIFVAGQQVIAKTDLPLTPGTDILLEAFRNKDGVSFKLAGPETPTRPANIRAGRHGALVRLFSQINSALPELGKTQEPSIQNILQTLSLKSGTRDDRFLPRLLENMGLTLEKKVQTAMLSSDKSTITPRMDLLGKQDLKAAILQFLSLESEGAAPKASLRGVANALENLQQLNTQTGDSNRFVIPFPMLSGEQLDFGQLFINTGKKKNETQAGENRVIQIAFLMNMTALGRIRADFSILKKEITGRFMLEDQECCDYMNGLIPELKHQLISLAYRPGKIECQVAKPRTLSADALIQSMIKPDESRGLDLVI